MDGQSLDDNETIVIIIIIIISVININIIIVVVVVVVVIMIIIILRSSNSSSSSSSSSYIIIFVIHCYYHSKNRPVYHVLPVDNLFGRVVKVSASIAADLDSIPDEGEWGWGGGREPEYSEKTPGDELQNLTGGLIVVDVDALQLQIGVAVVGAGGVNAVLVGDHLPEL